MSTTVTTPWRGVDKMRKAISWCMEFRTAHVFVVCIEEEYHAVDGSIGIIRGVRRDISFGEVVGVKKNYAEHILFCIERSPGRFVSFIFESEDDATLFALSFSSVDPALDENLLVEFK